MKYKLIVSDFDGTLYGKNKQVNPKNIEAIKRFTEKGGKFTVSTGRMNYSLRNWVKTLGITDQEVPVMGYNGSYAVNKNGEIVVGDFLSHETVDFILSTAEKLGVYSHFYDDKFVYIKEENDINRNYRTLTDIVLNEVGNLREFLHKNPSLIIPKAMVVVDEKDLASVKAEVDKASGGRYRCFASDVNLIDFASPTSGKDAGLRKIAQYFGLDMSEVIAIGDSQNDADMLRAAGLGVAVQNAWPEAKKNADFITERIADEGAIAEVIEKFCLCD
ncbi:MAG: HAD family phosphatase [Clostridia bacterium]|nr:HAD family phosphatase [Clostridia bacterium]